MKKLLGIVVLGLLLCGNAYAELITLTNCYQFKDQSTVPGDKPLEFRNLKEQTAHREIFYEDLLFTLDTVTEVVTSTMITKDSWIKSQLENNNYVWDKFAKATYKITDLGGNVATAEGEPSLTVKSNKLDLDFVSNKVYRTIRFEYIDGSKYSSSTIYQCKRQK